MQDFIQLLCEERNFGSDETGLRWQAHVPKILVSNSKGDQEKN